MQLAERIAMYLNKVGCADVGEIANEMPCSDLVAYNTLKCDAAMFWQSKDGMWFVVGKLSNAVDADV